MPKRDLTTIFSWGQLELVQAALVVAASELWGLLVLVLAMVWALVAAAAVWE